jgi:hypothetical protein
MTRHFASRPTTILAIMIGLLIGAAPAVAGPPYLTDDPEPTDSGHWEIYNFATAQGGAGGLQGETGLDLNYGGAKDLQLTAVIPLGFENARDSLGEGLRGGPGNIELAVKYKFLHQSDGSWLPAVSLFPRVFVPVVDRFGISRVNLFLPLWAEKDLGVWSLFGGGGYQINPGPHQRDFWQGGLALTRTFGSRLSLGGEVFGQTANTRLGGGYTALNLGATYRLTKHWSLLTSAGPTWEQGGSHGEVVYLSLKADY